MIQVIAIAFGVVIIATVIFAVIRRARLNEGEILLIKETIFTVILGIALWIEAGVLLFYSISLSQQYNISQNAIINLYIFLAVSTLLGAVIILYGVIKCTGVSKNGIRCTDLLGKSENISWGDIKGAKQTTGKRVVFTAADGKTYSVGGSRAAFKEFIKLGCDNIENRETLVVLSNLKTALKMK